MEIIYCNCGLLIKEVGCECKWWHPLIVPISEFLPFVSLKMGKYKREEYNL